VTKRIRGTFLISVLAITALTAACGSGGTSKGGSGGGNGVFTLALTTDPGALNPYRTTLGTARQIFAFGYDTLLNRSPDGGVISGLAQKWDSTATSATYTLRQEITCADGTPLKASDVAADFTYIADPKTLSPWLGLTVPVPYTASADDAARTVTITTKQPFGELLLGAGSLPIVCPGQLSKPQGLDHAFGGTGPYKVSDYVAGDHYTLQARPDYTWGPGGATTKAKGLPQKVSLRFVPNETTAANLLLSKAINAAQVNGPDGARLKAARLSTVSVPIISGEFSYNEMPNRPLNDQRVRKALTMALSMDDLVAASTHGTGKRATNLIAETPVPCPGDVVTSVMPTGSPDDAARLLDEAGWTGNAQTGRSKNGQPLRLKGIFYAGQPDPAAAMELVGQQWQKLGVKLDLTPVTNAVFNQTMYGSGDWDIGYTGLNVEYPFMLAPFYSGAVPPQGRNSGHVNNAAFEDLVAKATAIPGKASCDLWNEAWKALLSGADIVPLSVGDRTFYLNNAKLDKVGLFAVPTSLRLLS
jgi:peptide/nickel transport system substrate-binding protein